MDWLYKSHMDKSQKHDVGKKVSENNTLYVNKIIFKSFRKICTLFIYVSKYPKLICCVLKIEKHWRRIPTTFQRLVTSGKRWDVRVFFCNYFFFLLETILRGT